VYLTAWAVYLTTACWEYLTGVCYCTNVVPYIPSTVHHWLVFLFTFLENGGLNMLISPDFFFLLRRPSRGLHSGKGELMDSG